MFGVTTLSGQGLAELVKWRPALQLRAPSPRQHSLMHFVSRSPTGGSRSEIRCVTVTLPHYRGVQAFPALELLYHDSCEL